MSYLMLSGFGDVAPPIPTGGSGQVFGPDNFNAEAIWVDCLAGSGGNNAAGKRCGQAVQMALNKLGYGPLVVDGQIGSGTIAAIKRFSADNGFGTATWPTKPMLIKMEELLKAGQKPGPGAAIDAHVVGGEVVPGSGSSSGLSTAGMGLGLALGIGAVALLGIGAIAVMAKKKKAGGFHGVTKGASL